MATRDYLTRIREPLRIDSGLAGKLWLYDSRPNFAPMKPHVHIELEFNLCIRGEAEYLIGGRRVALHPGRILWLFPEQDHALRRVTEDFEMWIAVFRPTLLKHACRQQEHRAMRDTQPPDDAITYAQLAPAQARELSQSCQHAKDEHRANATDRFNAKLQLLLLEAWTQTQQAGQQRPTLGTLHPTVYRAAMQLYDDPTCESLAELAQGAGLSLEHLSRLFAKQMAQTMTAYRSEQRLRRFAQLADSERFNLTEAALEAGFGSYAQCYRVCMEHWGVKPSALKTKENRQTITSGG